MRKYPLFFVLLLSLLISLSSFAQKEIVIDNKTYKIHTVVKSETIFSICKTYNISFEELKAANRELKSVLKQGAVLRIPVKAKNETVNVQESAPLLEPEFYYHKVLNKQTVFSIAQKYKISAKELEKYNPEIKSGLIEGQVLRIPVKNETDDFVISRTQPEINNTNNVNENSFHFVVSGETLYSLSNKYNVTQEQLIKLNPELNNGLKTGMKLQIPNINNQNFNSISENKNGTKYKVERGETLFSIAGRFGIDVDDLKSMNPSLYSRTLETGEIIIIPEMNLKRAVSKIEVKPVENEFKVDEFSSSNCLPVSNKNGQKYKVALLLPFYLPADNNDSGSQFNSKVLSKLSFRNEIYSTGNDTVMSLNGIKIDQRANGFIEFYEGALIALDSMQQKGMNVELFTFDVSSSKNIYSILQLEIFRELNLIIGPVYPELQEAVAAFAGKNRIPIVSPLAQTGNIEKNNSYFFKINPTKENQLNQTAKYVAREFSRKNFIMIKPSDNSESYEFQLGKLCKERLNGSSGNRLYNEYSFHNQGVIGIKSLLDSDKENFVMIPTDNEAQVSISLTNLNGLAENYNITLIGTPSQLKLKSIPTENFHKVKYRFLSPYFVDYDKLLVRSFVLKYRDVFASEPSQFSFQGFDVTYYFLNALYLYGKDFKNCIPDLKMELTQMNFDFKKVSQFGGYMNEALFINSYERNFDINNLGQANKN